MFELPRRCSSVALLTLAAVLGGPAVAAAPESTLFTTYTVDSTLQSATWSMCVSSGETAGCRSSGMLGPFGLIGAMLEGRPMRDDQSVTRDIYVLDLASASSVTGVSLYVYKKQDVVSVTGNTSTVTLERTISLPLVGGAEAHASMTANDAYVLAGTDKSTKAAAIERSTWVVTSVDGFSPPSPIVSVTSSGDGDVAVTFDTPGDPSSYGCIAVRFGTAGDPSSHDMYFVGPDGALEEDRGPADFTLADSDAIVPVSAP